MSNNNKVTIKNAPRVRKWVTSYLKTHTGLTLDDLARRYYTDGTGHKYNFYFTDGFCNQAKLMLREQKLNKQESQRPPQSTIFSRPDISVPHITRKSPQPAKELKVREAGKVHLRGKYIRLDTGNKMYVYRFELSRCNTALKILHWVNHLGGKTWTTKRMLNDFIVLTCQYHNINLYGH